MPRYDFWNNPLVVTAFRLKYRRGSLGVSTALDLLALVALGGLLQQFWVEPRTPWLTAYLVFMLAFQFAFSGMGSLIATSRSMHAEVNQRTLDFQRITSLSPRQILVGKLLGEPADRYLQALAIVPLVVLCGVAGAASLSVVAWLCVQLMTFCLMLGALGLWQPLEPSAGKGASGNQVAGLVVMLVFIISNMTLRAGAGGLKSGFGVALGIFSPIVDLVALYRGQPQLPAVDWFGIAVPSLWMAPLVQLAIAAVVLRGMARKLLNPAFSLLSKPVAYATIVLLDVLLAGLLYDPSPTGPALDRLTAAFIGGHLAIALMLLLDLTPGKPGLLSWLWRFRRRQSWLRSSLLGDRGENSLPALTFAALGLIDWLGLVWLPAFLAGSAPGLNSLDAATLHFLGGGTLLLLALAVALQWTVLIAPKSGAKLLAIGLVIVIVPPAVVGNYYEIDWLQGLSPLGQLIAWVEAKPLPIFPFYALYGLMLCGGWALLRRRLSEHAAIIDRKLGKMLGDGALHNSGGD